MNDYMNDKIMALVIRTRVLRMLALYLCSVFMCPAIKLEGLFFAIALITSYKQILQFLRIPTFSKFHKALYGMISLLMLLTFAYGTFKQIQTDVWNAVAFWGLLGFLLVAICVGIIRYSKFNKKGQLDKAIFLTLVDLYADVLLYFIVFLCTLRF